MTPAVVFTVILIMVVLAGIWLVIDTIWMHRPLKHLPPRASERIRREPVVSLSSVDTFLHPTGLPAARVALVREGHCPKSEGHAPTWPSKKSA